jgi:Domain of unknown function (DUF4396)
MSWLQMLSWISIALGVVTAAVISIDLTMHPQRMRIMNIVWPITGLYLPLIGLAFYYALGRPMAVDAPPMKGERPYWQRVFLSATHCGSGCVLGDVIGAPIVFAFGLTLLGTTLFADYAAEFVLAYIFGIAFQYFPIRRMQQISPHEAVFDAVKADSLSLAAFEVGMFGWMAIVYYALLPWHPRPDTAVFWFMMQIAMICGFLTTYPANWLLVRWGVKEGM